MKTLFDKILGRAHVVSTVRRWSYSIIYWQTLLSWGNKSGRLSREWEIVGLKCFPPRKKIFCMPIITFLH